jgi:hypothetical protein
MMDLFLLAEHLGHILGRDSVMRLGQDGFTPDIYFIGNQGLRRQHEMYLDGPADLVVEVLMPGFEACDRVMKFSKYELGHVPEYWILDPVERIFDAYQLQGGKYTRRALNAEGQYLTPALPGLRLCVDRIWDDSHDLQPCLIVDQVVSTKIVRPKYENDLLFGSLPFLPRIDLHPEPIAFDEYITWAPESKIEGYNNRIYIAGRIGTRNVLGMLMMTFGLIETVRLLPPRLWIDALLRLGDRNQDLQRKAHGWELAQKAARALRDRHGVGRVVVIGNLLSDMIWSTWSEVTLVVWDKPNENIHRVWQTLDSVFGDIPFNLIQASEATDQERQAIETGRDI